MVNYTHPARTVTVSLCKPVSLSKPVGRAVTRSHLTGVALADRARWQAARGTVEAYRARQAYVLSLRNLSATRP